MDEALSAALARGAERMAERVREHVAALGVRESDVRVEVEGERVRVICSSPDLSALIHGHAGVAPGGSMDALRQRIPREVALGLAEDLGEGLR